MTVPAPSPVARHAEAVAGYLRAVSTALGTICAFLYFLYDFHLEAVSRSVADPERTVRMAVGFRTPKLIYVSESSANWYQTLEWFSFGFAITMVSMHALVRIITYIRRRQRRRASGAP